MSVDYDAVYGIGFEIDGAEYDEDDLEELLSDSDDYKREVSGNFFTGNDLRSYVFINKDLTEIAENVKDEKKKLEGFLSEKGLVSIGEFGLHGGSRVW